MKRELKYRVAIINPSVAPDRDGRIEILYEKYSIEDAIARYRRAVRNLNDLQSTDYVELRASATNTRLI